MSKHAESIARHEDFIPFTPERIAQIAGLLSEPDAILKTLPAEEQELYNQAQQSVVDARDRAGALTLEEIKRRQAGFF